MVEQETPAGTKKRWRWLAPVAVLLLMAATALAYTFEVDASLCAAVSETSVADPLARPLHGSAQGGAGLRGRGGRPEAPGDARLPCTVSAVQPGHNRAVAATTAFAVDVETVQCVVQGRDAAVAELRLTIRECPPAYSSSAFAVEATMDGAVTMGRVSGRVEFDGGCALYRAAVPVMGSGSVSVDVQLVSRNRDFSLREEDIRVFHEAKEKELSQEEWRKMLRRDTVAFLTNQRFSLEGMPLTAEVALPKVPGTGGRAALPSCHELPLEQWSPSRIVAKEGGNLGKYDWQPARCRLERMGPERMGSLLRGLRIKMYGDSNYQNTFGRWLRVLCPEMETAKAFFEANYHCPGSNKGFEVAWRFFRGVYEDIGERTDMDGISAKVRAGYDDACSEFIGVGQYNVTVLSIPTWSYVYESSEGLRDYFLALRSIIDRCRRDFPADLARHPILLQSTTAANFPPGLSDRAWRAIRNSRIEDWLETAQAILGDRIDGIIPAFDLTYAMVMRRENMDREILHFTNTVYDTIVQLQAHAFVSAVAHRGISPVRGGPTPSWYLGMGIDGL